MLHQPTWSAVKNGLNHDLSILVSVINHLLVDQLATKYFGI